MHLEAEQSELLAKFVEAHLSTAAENRGSFICTWPHNDKQATFFHSREQALRFQGNLSDALVLARLGLLDESPGAGNSTIFTVMPQAVEEWRSHISYGSGRDPLAMTPPRHFDVFISYASEDRESIARPIYNALVEKGCAVWFDEAVLELGDSLRQKIDEGLSKCRYGVVILSPAFFRKEWPKRELDGLVARETASGSRAILPVWYNLSHSDVATHSPTLADRVAVRSSDGIEAVAEKVIGVLARPNSGPSMRFPVSLSGTSAERASPGSTQQRGVATDSTKEVDVLNESAESNRSPHMMDLSREAVKTALQDGENLITVIREICPEAQELDTLLASLSLTGGGRLLVGANANGRSGSLVGPLTPKAIEALSASASRLGFRPPPTINAVKLDEAWIAYCAFQPDAVVNPAFDGLTLDQLRLLLALIRAERTGRYRSTAIAAYTFEGWFVVFSSRSGHDDYQLNGEFEETDLHALREEGYLTLITKPKQYDLSLKPKAIRSYEQALRRRATATTPRA